MNKELNVAPLVSNDVISGTHSIVLSDITPTPLPMRDDSVSNSFTLWGMVSRKAFVHLQTVYLMVN
jgi:hypothetical protein